MNIDHLKLPFTFRQETFNKHEISPKVHEISPLIFSFQNKPSRHSLSKTFDILKEGFSKFERFTTIKKMECTMVDIYIDYTGVTLFLERNS